MELNRLALGAPVAIVGTLLATAAITGKTFRATRDGSPFIVSRRDHPDSFWTTIMYLVFVFVMWTAVSFMVITSPHGR